MAKKGTVTELASLFPAEEAQKASIRVQETIAERRRELDRVKSFVDDNTSIINLVRKLPDETHHNIMVPFGPAAFFPGRMTNPNKFLVLLGEGYHAERSAKQTVEILKRRGRALENQVESLNAVVEDLKLEASFFDKTARESEEGVVEIREDYIEEAPSIATPVPGYKRSDSVPPLEVDNGEAAVEDEEYARIFSRMAELEKEEEEAELEKEEEEAELEKEEEEEAELEKEEEEEAEFDKEEEDAEEANGSKQDLRIQNEQKDNKHDYPDPEVRSVPAATQEAPVVSREGAFPRDYPARNNVVVNKDVELPTEEKIRPFPPASNTAFTGSIIEHSHNVGANAPQQQARSSKPVSRFKMQRK